MRTFPANLGLPISVLRGLTLCLMVASAAIEARSDPDGSLPESVWWSFKPVRRPNLPGSISGGSPARVGSSNPIDLFILEKLSQKGIAPGPSASSHALLRRICFDLTGLPPSADQVRAFEKDHSEAAFEKLVDALLASPAYGERWGRHWLDVVRFAQSNGYERDGEKPFAWRYRDYVIRSFNEDKPYDLFVREHLAGDEMAEDFFRNGSGFGSEWDWRQAVVATGFSRLGVFDDEPDDKKMAVFDELDDMLSTTGAAFLGLTLGCARCHDHKFDPIAHEDYYGLLAFFRGVKPYSGGIGPESTGIAPLADPHQVLAWKEDQNRKVREVEASLARATSDPERKTIQKALEQLKAQAAPFEWALAMREGGTRPDATHVLLRGNAEKEGREVKPGVPGALLANTPQVQISVPPDGSATSGRRSALATWMVSPANPLTARVMVNRVWHHHFGRGLVRSTTDFGRAGSLPTHPELLDWLAAEFVSGGWSLKKLHRLIVTSEVWKRSSEVVAGKGVELDPANEFLWRQNMRRLEAECIRDNLLAISGLLNLKAGGRGFFPRLSAEVLAGSSRPGTDWEISSDDELVRRSVYAFVRRTSPVPMLETLDYNNYSSPLGERPVTTVAPQALLLLNDDFVRLQAEAFATKLLKTRRGDSQLVDAAYRTALGRPPSGTEQTLATRFLSSQRSAFSNLSTRVTVRTTVPQTIGASFFSLLKPGDFVAITRPDWKPDPGRWPDSYEGNRMMDRAGGPYALWQTNMFQDGIISANILLHTAGESAGLLLRWEDGGPKAGGYEVVFRPRERSVVLRRIAESATTLVSAELAMPVGASFPFKIEIAGSTIRCWAFQERAPVIDVQDPMPLIRSGRLGARTWGAPLSLDDLSIASAGTRWSVPPLAGVEINRHAAESLCLLILNLNETSYVD